MAWTPSSLTVMVSFGHSPRSRRFSIDLVRDSLCTKNRLWKIAKNSEHLQLRYGTNSPKQLWLKVQYLSSTCSEVFADFQRQFSCSDDAHNKI